MMKVMMMMMVMIVSNQRHEMSSIKRLRLFDWWCHGRAFQMVRTSDSSARLPKEKTDKKEWHKNESRLPVGSYSDSRSARYNRRTSCTHIPVHTHIHHTINGFLEFAYPLQTCRLFVICGRWYRVARSYRLCWHQVVCKYSQITNNHILHYYVVSLYTA